MSDAAQIFLGILDFVQNEHKIREDARMRQAGIDEFKKLRDDPNSGSMLEFPGTPPVGTDTTTGQPVAGAQPQLPPPVRGPASEPTNKIPDALSGLVMGGHKLNGATLTEPLTLGEQPPQSSYGRITPNRAPVNPELPPRPAPTTGYTTGEPALEGWYGGEKDILATPVKDFEILPEDSPELDGARVQGIPSSAFLPKLKTARYEFKLNSATGGVTTSQKFLTLEDAKLGTYQLFAEGLRRGMPLTQIAFHAQTSGFPLTIEMWNDIAHPTYIAAREDQRQYFQSIQKQKGWTDTEVEYYSARAAQRITGGYRPEEDKALLDVPVKAYETTIVESALIATREANKDKLGNIAGATAYGSTAGGNEADRTTKTMTVEELLATGAPLGSTMESAANAGHVALSAANQKILHGYKRMYTTIEGFKPLIDRIFTIAENDPRQGARLQEYLKFSIEELSGKGDLAAAIAAFKGKKAELVDFFNAAGTQTEGDIFRTIESFGTLGFPGPQTRHTAMTKLYALESGIKAEHRAWADTIRTGYTGTSIEPGSASRPMPDPVVEGRKMAEGGTPADPLGAPAPQAVAPKIPNRYAPGAAPGSNGGPGTAYPKSAYAKPQSQAALDALNTFLESQPDIEASWRNGTLDPAEWNDLLDNINQSVEGR